MPDGSNDAAYIAYGASFSGRLLECTISGYNINGYDYLTSTASAVLLNDQYVLTAAHVADIYGQFGFNIGQVATGPNFKTNVGTTASFSQVLIYPGWNENVANGSVPDIAILKLDQPLLPNQPALQIGSASTGEVVTSAGFGDAGTLSGSVTNASSLPSLDTRDGNSRAWDAEVNDDLFTAIIGGDTNSYQTDMWYTPGGIAMNGKGLPGDSGGPVFNSAGDLIGIDDFVDLPYRDSGVGYTAYTKLSSPDVLAWIEANTAVPEPGTLAPVTMLLLLLARSAK